MLKNKTNRKNILHAKIRTKDMRRKKFIKTSQKLSKKVGLSNVMTFLNDDKCHDICHDICHLYDISVTYLFLRRVGE